MNNQILPEPQKNFADFNEKTLLALEPYEHGTSELREVIKHVSYCFSEQLSKTMKTNFSVDDFILDLEHNIAVGITSGGKLMAISLESWTYEEIKVEKDIDKIISNHLNTLAFALDNESVTVISLPDSKVITKVKCLSDCVESIVSIPDNKFVTCDGNWNIATYEWDGITINKLHSVKCKIKDVYEAKLSPNGELALVHNETHVVLLDTKGTKLHEIPYEDGPNYMSFTPNSDYFVLPIEIHKKKSIKTEIQFFSTKAPYAFNKKLRLKLNREADSKDKKIDKLYFTKDQQYLITAFSDGGIKIWELYGQKRRISMPLHETTASLIQIDSKNMYIYSTCNSDHAFSKTPFPEFTNDQRKKIAYVEASKELKGRDTVLMICDTFMLLINLSNYSIEKKAIAEEDTIKNFAHSKAKNLIYFSVTRGDDSIITCWNLDMDEESIVISKLEEETNCLVLSENEDTLYLGGADQKIQIYDTLTWTKIRELVGHKNEISDLLYVKEKNILVSASLDDTVRVWEINKNYAYYELLGHTKTISQLATTVDKKILITASSDKTIGLWNLIDYSLIKFLKGHKYSVASIYSTLNGKYLYSIDEGYKLKLWSLDTYDCIFTESYGKYEKFLITSNEEKMFLIGDDYMKIIDNPLNGQTVRVVGTENKVKFMMGIYELITKKSLPEDTDKDFYKGVITPYMLTPIHLFVIFNIPNELKKALDAKSPLLYTSGGENPLSIAVQRRFKECITIVIKGLKKQGLENPYCLACVNSTTIIELNSFKYPALFNLYTLFLTKSKNQKLPQFIDQKIHTPVYQKHTDIMASEQKFNFEITDEGKAVVYWESTIKMNYALGSSQSIEFLRSILQTPNTEIFKTLFLQKYLAYKWTHLRWFTYLQALIYMIYLTSIVILIFLDKTDWEPMSLEVYLYIPFIINIVLTIYELFQMLTAFQIYWENILNYIDMLRSIHLFLYVAIEIFEVNLGDSDTLLIGLCSLSFLRGLSYFRVFGTTRYMVNLLTEVIRDMIAFLILLLYTTASFALLFFLLIGKENDSFGDYLVNSYILNLGDFDSSLFTTFEYIIFVGATIINPIIMLNLLIAIMGDTYDRVQENVEIADSKELAEMILEAEIFMFFRRNSKVLQYLQICEDDESGERDHEWHGKVRELKKLLKKNKNRSKRIECKLDEFILENNEFVKGNNEFIKGTNEKLDAIIKDIEDKKKEKEKEEKKNRKKKEKKEGDEEEKESEQKDKESDSSDDDEDDSSDDDEDDSSDDDDEI